MFYSIGHEMARAIISLPEMMSAARRLERRRQTGNTISWTLDVSSRSLHCRRTAGSAGMAAQKYFSRPPIGNFRRMPLEPPAENAARRRLSQRAPPLHKMPRHGKPMTLATTAVIPSASPLATPWPKRVIAPE